jgi:hypothetical protein
VRVCVCMYVCIYDHVVTRNNVGQSARVLAGHEEGEQPRKKRRRVPSLSPYNSVYISTYSLSLSLSLSVYKPRAVTAFIRDVRSASVGADGGAGETKKKASGETRMAFYIVIIIPTPR